MDSQVPAPTKIRVHPNTEERSPFLSDPHGRAGFTAVWCGFRLERWSITHDITLQESALAAHVLVLNVGPQIQGYIKFAGDAGGYRTSDTGMVGVTPANHPYTVDSSGCEVLALVIEPSFLGELAIAGHREVTVPPTLYGELPLIREGILAISSDVQAGQPFGDTYAESVCAMVATDLVAKSGLRPATERTGIRQADKAALLRYIEANLAEPLKLRDLAPMVGMTPSAFCKAFKVSIGLPPHTYLLRQRLEKAKDLMVRSRLPLAEIASVCGFASQSHFNDVFVRFVGQPPGRYRSLLVGRAASELN